MYKIVFKTFQKIASGMLDIYCIEMLLFMQIILIIQVENFVWLSTNVMYIYRLA